MFSRQVLQSPVKCRGEDAGKLPGCLVTLADVKVHVFQACTHRRPTVNPLNGAYIGQQTLPLMVYLRSEPTFCQFKAHVTGLATSSGTLFYRFLKYCRYRCSPLRLQAVSCFSRTTIFLNGNVGY